MTKDDWLGLYGEGWQSEIVPEAFQHPAKFSRALIRRIYDHAFLEGWLKAGDRVLDCFGGVSLGALDAMRLGLDWTGVELEPKFIDTGSGCDCDGFTKEDWKRYQGRYSRIPGKYLCPTCWDKTHPKKSRIIPSNDPHHYTGNIEFWLKRYAPHFPGWGTARLVQGDSRQLLQIVGQAEAVVSSPPYAFSDMGGHGGEGPQAAGAPNAGKISGQASGFCYGSDPSNLGNLRSTAAGYELAVSSPPYAESMEREGGIDPAKSEHIGGPHSQMNNSDTRYGSTPGQLGAMRATNKFMPARGFEAAVSSPPWSGSLNDGLKEDDRIKYKEYARAGKSMGNDYGSEDGQLGNSTGSDFWTAARAIVDQVYGALIPGGYAIFVVKDYVKDKQRVPFSEQWAAMCEAAGFELLHWHRAWLIEDRGTQIDLWGNGHNRTIQRKSFFRRLAEKKGSPRIDFESVICMRKRDVV